VIQAQPRPPLKNEIFKRLLETDNSTNRQCIMKNTLIATIGVVALIALSTTSLLAQEKKETKPAQNEGGSGHSHFTKIPEKVEDIWKEINKQKKLLAKVVEEKDLGEAHDHAFAIRDLVKALPKKVDAESKSHAEEASKTITKLAADIDKSGAARAQKATEDNVKKMDAAVTALEKKLSGKSPQK
jgi:hypothetical protein